MKRTPWRKLAASTRERARAAGVTEVGYRAGAWYPGKRGARKPATRSQVARERSLNRYGFTGAQLRGWPPNLRASLAEAQDSGADLGWLLSIPVPIRAQAFRYWRDRGELPPLEDIEYFKRHVPSWKKPLIGKEANLFFAQHKPIPEVANQTRAFDETAAHGLRDPAYRRRTYFGMVDANRATMDEGERAPDWFWWYH